MIKGIVIVMMLMAVCSLSARPYYCGSLGKGFFKEEYSKNLLVSAAAGFYRSDFLFELPFYGEVVPLMSLKGSAALVDGAKPIPSLFYSLRLIPAENLAHITGFTGFGYSFGRESKGFSFEMGIGFDIPISENALAQLDAGICSMGKADGLFLRIGGGYRK